MTSVIVTSSRLVGRAEWVGDARGRDRAGEVRPATWVVAAAVTLLLGLASYSAGGYVQRACSGHYNDKSVVIGTQMMPLGATYKQQNPDLSADEILFDAAGVVERIWTRSSIGRCRTLLGTTYFLGAVPYCLPARHGPGGAGDAPVTGAMDTPTPGPKSPEQPARYDVFLSYRHDGADMAFARRLLDALEADGYRVAIDERDFPAHASFLLEMERCVRQSRFTVAVISARYLSSDNCQEEAIICKVLDMGDRTRRLIPLIIEPVSMPAWLYGIVGIDCTKPDPLLDPFEKLKATLGSPAATV